MLIVFILNLALSESYWASTCQVLTKANGTLHFGPLHQHALVNANILAAKIIIIVKIFILYLVQIILLGKPSFLNL